MHLPLLPSEVTVVSAQPLLKVYCNTQKHPTAFSAPSNRFLSRPQTSDRDGYSAPPPPRWRNDDYEMPCDQSTCRGGRNLVWQNVVSIFELRAPWELNQGLSTLKSGTSTTQLSAFTALHC